MMGKEALGHIQKIKVGMHRIFLFKKIYFWFSAKCIRYFRFLFRPRIFFGASLIKSYCLQKQLDVNNTRHVFQILQFLFNSPSAHCNTFFPFYQDELEWGKENCIQIKRIREVNTAHKCANFIQNLSSPIACLLQVAELFEDMKKRVSRFNMHISSSSNPTDYTSLHKQRFILQV